jgi:hypothetical protein
MTTAAINTDTSPINSRNPADVVVVVILTRGGLIVGFVNLTKTGTKPKFCKQWFK